MFIKYSVVYLLSPALLLVWDASYLRAGTELASPPPISGATRGAQNRVCVPRVCVKGMHATAVLEQGSF